MPIRVVFDTNVFVAALLKTSGLTARLLSLWQKGRLTLIFSEETIAEVLDVLTELGVAKSHRQRVESLIRRPKKRRSIVVTPRQRLTIVPHEPDNRFLEAAVEGRAAYLVTNNKQHFQDAGITEFRGVHIVSISEFLELMELV
jgi:putative PIN family toxin of toxin-antitoxin system